MENINHAEREHALLSASSAARWLACPPSAVAAEAYPQQDTAFTREGTLAHEVAEITARYGEDMTIADVRMLPGMEDAPAEMFDCAQGYRDYIQELKTTDDAVILLEQRVDFSPWVPDGFGTCDCIILQGETMDVIDYKFGKEEREHIVQIEQYIKVLKTMGYTSVKGYVWYVPTGKITPIGN